jgi:gamma-glutamyltranspeptidase/glutathione hydrolase
VVDSRGNAAAITYTLNGSFGSGVTVTGAGFLLNNEMDDFAAAPGKPNQYGLVESETNSIAPGKRMLSSMTPSLVLGVDGELEMVVGSPGGPTIITTVYHVISNVLDHAMTLEQAVESPRAHHQALPDTLFLEKDGFDRETISALEARGHSVTERSGHSGDVSAILRIGEQWRGVADPRRGGGASAPQSAPSSSPR